MQLHNRIDHLDNTNLKNFIKIQFILLFKIANEKKIENFSFSYAKYSIIVVV